MIEYGPRTPLGRAIHATKYRIPGETFDDYCVRYARALTDDEKSFRRLLHYLREQVLLPAGRQQHSIGRPYSTTAYNCFVGGTIEDSYSGILDALKLGGETLRAGGGVGWDFSTIRPSGEPIRGMGPGSYASGPVSFMNIWDANCEVILTAGHRRGAMMGVLRVDHPDILQFVNAKRGTGRLKNFNISVAVTDAFMEALYRDGLFTLRFAGRSWGEVRALDIWAPIMEANWDWAEPGALFIDRINQTNPLYYCERIAATNPCAEQPLPPYGSCLLGSINLAKLVTCPRPGIDWEVLGDVVDAAVRAFDNVPERTVFPLLQQRAEALNKRRMGLGVTGLANALEIMGHPYGSPDYLREQDRVLGFIARQAYRTSTQLAREKGPFPLFDADLYLAGDFVQRLPDDIREGIRRDGIRNGVLLSVAPTGTISMAADNVSSGIEPPYALRTELDVVMPEGKVTFTAEDYASERWGVACRTSGQVSAEEHIDVLCGAQRWVDSSISKTCNVDGRVGGEGPGVSFEEFKELYLRAWEGGAKGCTTFNKNGKLMGVRREAESVGDDGAACVIDEFGRKSCAVDL